MFSDVGDFLRDSPAYQWIKEEGFEEGGRKSLSGTLLNLVHKRFPTLDALAQSFVDRTSDLKTLSSMILEISFPCTEQEAQGLLQADQQK